MTVIYYYFSRTTYFAALFSTLSKSSSLLLGDLMFTLQMLSIDLFRITLFPLSLCISTTTLTVRVKAVFSLTCLVKLVERLTLSTP